MYPSGLFIKTEKGYFYILAQGKRARILTKRTLDSYNPHRVVETTEAAVAKYKVTGKMKFRNGSLIHSLADGSIYYISEGNRRHVVSPEALERIGAVRTDAVTVSLDEINLHPEGEPLT